MFCPKCKAEYRSGFARCSDCEVELVDSLSPESYESIDFEYIRSSDYVVVATLQTQLEADQICSFLRANGIAAVADGERLRDAYGIKIGGMSGLLIRVPRDLAASASDLLAKADRGELVIDEDDEEGALT